MTGGSHKGVNIWASPRADRPPAQCGPSARRLLQFTSQSFIGRHMPLSSSIVVGICPVTDAWINILLKGGSMSLEMGASAPLPMDASKLVATSNNL